MERSRCGARGSEPDQYSKCHGRESEALKSLRKCTPFFTATLTRYYLRKWYRELRKHRILRMGVLSRVVALRSDLPLRAVLVEKQLTCLFGRLNDRERGSHL